jgi:hypothetical protein
MEGKPCAPSSTKVQVKTNSDAVKMAQLRKANLEQSKVIIEL